MSIMRYWVWLSSLPHVSAVSANALLRRFETPERVFAASETELREVWLTGDAIKSILAHEMSAADRILADCEKQSVRILTLGDIEYSDRLRNIYDPPVVIYVRGRMPAIDSEAVFGLVGTRSASPYGVRMAERIGYELARSGLVVATGLALGIDTSGALGALRGGGRVIGVLGGGTDVVYPRENERLYEDVAAQGALISEYPPGTNTASGHFPARNRILSGLSVGIGVIEAPAKSGALITASRALEQGRDVFAMPGNVDSAKSAGANRLLREGAIPLISADDVINEYQMLFPERIPEKGGEKVRLTADAEAKLVKTQSSGKKRPAGSDSGADTAVIIVPEAKAPPSFNAEAAAEPLPEPQKSVFLALAAYPASPVYIDDLISKAGLPASDIVASLTLLEIEGLVSSAGAGFYSISK